MEHTLEASRSPQQGSSSNSSGASASLVASPSPPPKDAATVSARTHVLGGTGIFDLARYIVQRDIRKILVLIGAGVSVAAGIPDFRSPNTGLYANLGKYNLDEPSDAFSLSLLRESPDVFYTIANEMNLWPGAYQPTAVHHFVKLLSDQGRLLRCCTQNIDGLERAAGLPAELLVEAHGSFRTASCIDCHRPFDIQRNRMEANRGSISHCDECGGIVKPDVVFFSEQLPDGFFHVLTEDAPAAELVLIIGTSLQVRPFALLPLHAAPETPRVLINMERVGGRMFLFPDDDDYLAQLLATAADEEAEDSDSSSTSSTSSDRVQDGGTVRSSLREATPLADAIEAPENAAPNPPGGSAVVVQEAKLNEEDDAADPREGHGKGSSETAAAETPDDASEASHETSSSDGFLEYEEFTSQYHNTVVFRDLFLKGDCQRVIKRLATAMGLGDKLEAAIHSASCVPVPASSSPSDTP